MSNLRAFKILIILLMSGCSNSYNNDDCPSYELKQEYLNEKLGFSVGLPDDYYIIENYETLNLGALKDSEDSTYFEAFGVTVEPNTLNYKLEEFYKVSLNYDKEDYIKQYGNFKIIDQGKLIINHNDTYWNVYTYDSEKALNYFFIFKDRTYRVIFLSNIDQFDSLSCKFHSISNTMNIF